MCVRDSGFVYLGLEQVYFVPCNVVPDAFFWLTWVNTLQRQLSDHLEEKVEMKG